MIDSKAAHIDVIKKWSQELPVYADKLPARGTIAGALHLLERLKTDYTLDIHKHQAKGGAQIAGLSAQATTTLLAGFGEKRSFLKEGGRTNRGGPGDLGKLLTAMENLALHKVSAAERNAKLSDMQRYVVERLIPEYFNRKRLEFVFDPEAKTSATIASILAKAIAQKKGGPVAEHLVGAKLQMRFPQENIRNKSTSTADDQTGAVGDFQINQTSFHVSVSPMLGHWEKCKRNLEQGFRVYMLVPESWLVGSRQIAEQTAQGRIAVESIESFVATNLDELSTFSKTDLVGGLKQLLKLYNTRVDSVESDKSLMIEIPKNLQ